MLTKSTVKHLYKHFQSCYLNNLKIIHQRLFGNENDENLTFSWKLEFVDESPEISFLVVVICSARSVDLKSPSGQQCVSQNFPKFQLKGQRLV